MAKEKKNSKLKKFTLLGVNFFFFFLLSISCIEKDFADISVDESLDWEPSWSIPIGETSLEANDFLNSLSAIDTFPSDTFFVHYRDSLYLLDEPQIEIYEEVEFDPGQLADDPSLIQYLKIRTVIENAFPNAFLNQIYFYSTPDNLIDSLFESKRIISPADINEEHKVSESSVEVIEVELDSTQINKIYDTDFIRIYGAIQLTSEELENIEFKESYQVNVKMGLQTQLKINPSF